MDKGRECKITDRPSVYPCRLVSVEKDDLSPLVSKLAGVNILRVVRSKFTVEIDELDL